MARVRDLDAFRKKALTTALPATRKNGTARLGLHSGAESKLTPTSALRRLIGAFHRKSGIAAEIFR
jgi:hypothetical protein